MSKMPSARPRSAARSRSPQCTRWPCWLSRTRPRPGCSTRRCKTRSNSCWRYSRTTNRRSRSTRTRFSLTRATRDLKRWRFASSSPTRAGSTRATGSFTPTCSMLRSVAMFLCVFGFSNNNFLMTKLTWESTKDKHPLFSTFYFLHSTHVATVFALWFHDMFMI